MDTEKASRAIIALECLRKLMDLYQEYEKEEPKTKKRKMYVKSEDIESQILKDVAWKSMNSKDTFCPINMDNFEDIFRRISTEVNSGSCGVSLISFRMCLSITLRYLIRGDSYRTLERISHVSRKSISKIIPRILRLIIRIMEKDYLKLPNMQRQWLNIANDFNNCWYFPHTLGILDAKQFRVKVSDSQTHFSSLVLLSVIDAYSRFLHAEIIQCDEEINESAVYINSNLYKSLKLKSLNVPTNQPLEGQSVKTEYYFVGTEVFGMDHYVIKEYHKSLNLSTSQKAFNYRLNRVRLVEKRAFETLFNRFKIFEKLNKIDSCIAKLIIKVCCILHNYLTQYIKPFSSDINIVTLPNISIPLAMQIFETYEMGAQRRNNICNYCVNEGDLPEQWEDIIKKE